MSQVLLFLNLIVKFDYFFARINSTIYFNLKHSQRVINVNS